MCSESPNGVATDKPARSLPQSYPGADDGPAVALQHLVESPDSADDASHSMGSAPIDVSQVIRSVIESVCSHDEDAEPYDPTAVSERWHQAYPSDPHSQTASEAGAEPRSRFGYGLFADSKLARIYESLSGVRGEQQRQLALIGIEAAELVLRKNSDYGRSAFIPPVLRPTMSVDDALAVRESDKLAREQNLREQGRSPEVAESLRDTLLDRIGYRIVAVAIHDEESEQGQ